MVRGLALVVVSAAIGGSLAGCGASARPPDPSPVTTGSSHHADPMRRLLARPRLVKFSRTAYGIALVDRRGFALYRSPHDPKPASPCYGACATAWPPYLVPSKL